MQKGDNIIVPVRVEHWTGDWYERFGKWWKKSPR
jgi:hypothetical protein